MSASTDSTGAVLERYAYGDYGLPTVLAPDGVTVRLGGSLIGNRTLYTGRLWLAQLGVFDYRHRVLDPRTGRFAQRDPLGFVDGMNLYAYVGDGPYDGRDPTGLFSVVRTYNELYSLAMAPIDLLSLREEAARNPAADLQEGQISEALADGAMATADGFIPFADPFADQGGYDSSDPVNQLSVSLGAISRNSLASAAIAGVGVAGATASGTAATGTGGAGATGAASLLGAAGRSAIPRITGYTRHGLNQAISRDGSGVATRAILDAVTSPIKIVQQANGVIKYIGKDATVVLNQAGKVITTYANRASGIRIK